MAPETHFIRRFWLRRAHFGDLSVDANLDRLLDEVVALPELRSAHLDQDALRRSAAASNRRYADVFAALLQSFADRHGARIVGEKTPNHALYLAVLAQMFPAARALHVVRDPRAVVASWRDVPWSTGSRRGDAEVWRRYVVAVDRAARRRTMPVLEVRYEQLVRDPAATLSRVCDWIGIPFDDSMLATRDEGSSVDVASEPWKARSLRPIDADRAEAWRRELTADEVAAIEAVAGTVARRHGYALTSSARRWSATSIAVTARAARRAVKVRARDVRARIALR